MEWDQDMWDEATEVRTPLTTWEADQDSQEMLDLLRNVIRDDTEGCFIVIAYTKDEGTGEHRPVFFSAARTRGSGRHGLHFWKEATIGFAKLREEWAKSIVRDLLTHYDEEGSNYGSDV